MQHKALYQKICATYFVYYLFVGSFVPYWSLYLKHQGFSVATIGILLSLCQLMRIFVPNLWGWLVDSSGRHVAWIRLNALCGFCGFLAIFYLHDFWGVFFVMSVLSLFTSSVLPLTESLALAHLSSSVGYGRIRVWGSLGFIVASVTLGWLIDVFGVASVIWFMLIVQGALYCLSDSLLDPKPSTQHVKQLAIWQVLGQRNVLVLLIGCALMVSAHGILYNFYSIYLETYGYSKSTIGWLWSFGVICEILAFIAMPNIRRYLSLKTILLISLALAVVRFGLIGLKVHNLVWLTLAQSLHAATFGSFHAAAIAVIAKFFHGQHQARGQTIYNSVAYGIGGTLGGIVGGYALQYWGGQTTFLLATVFPLLGLAVVAFGLKLKE